MVTNTVSLAFTTGATNLYRAIQRVCNLIVITVYQSWVGNVSGNDVTSLVVYE